MKLHCKYSNTSYNIGGFPALLGTQSIHWIHPAFSIPTEQLVLNIPAYLRDTWNEKDTPLLFLALLNSTGLVSFRSFAAPSLTTCQSNMLALAQIAIKLSTLPAAIKEDNFARYCIDQGDIDIEDSGNNRLENISNLIKSWEESARELHISHRLRMQESSLEQRKLALDRVLSKIDSHPAKYGRRLAEWVSQAAHFPDTYLNLGGGKQEACSTYWKRLIVQAVSSDNVWSIPKGDILDILDWLESYLPIDTAYSGYVLKALERVLYIKDESLGSISDTLTESLDYVIIDDCADLDDFEYLEGSHNSGRASNTTKANLAILINSAPLEEPKESDYLNKILYIQAKAKYNLAKQARTVSTESDAAKESGVFSKSLIGGI